VTAAAAIPIPAFAPMLSPLETSTWLGEAVFAGKKGVIVEGIEEVIVEESVEERDEAVGVDAAKVRASPFVASNWKPAPFTPPLSCRWQPTGKVVCEGASRERM
jgi:hypothetical protein